MICFPNAKINLGLNVLSGRSDGFHNITSLLYPIPLFDVLEFFPSKTYKLSTFGAGADIDANDNLVTRVWQLMHELYGIPPLTINLLKHIPVGSGLGGGSADAAFLLKSVNELFNLQLKVAKLEKLALKIGSDCPFFIRNTPAVVSGRGELCKPIKFSLKNKYLVLVVPEIQQSTKDAFAKIVPDDRGQSVSQIIQQPVEIWRKSLFNDFEKPLFDLHPDLEIIKTGLYGKAALYASLTGSGTTFYGIFNDRPSPSLTDLGHRVYCLKLTD